MSYPAEIPKYVPFPQVEEATNGRIGVGELELPPGFNPMNLELNVRGVSRAATFAGLGNIMIASAGVMPAHAALQTRIDSPEAPRLNLLYRDATLPIDMEQVNAGIRRDELDTGWKRSSLDPEARAKYMDKELKYALEAAAKESYAITTDGALSTTLLSLTFPTGDLGIHEMVSAIPGYAGGLGFAAVSAAYLHVYARKQYANQKAANPDLPDRIRTVIPGAGAERVALTGIANRMTRMIRAAW